MKAEDIRQMIFEKRIAQNIDIDTWIEKILVPRFVKDLESCVFVYDPDLKENMLDVKIFKEQMEMRGFVTKRRFDRDGDYFEIISPEIETV